MFQHVVNSRPEINKPLSAKYVKSFAYPTFKKRLPDILQGIIEDLKNKEEFESKYGEKAVKELDAVIEKITSLKSGMENDQPLVEINANGSFSKHAAIYNKEIKQRQQENEGKPPTWFQTDWLFAECYNYFKLHDIFYTSSYLNEYDPFLRVKNDTLLASKGPVLQLSKCIVDNQAKCLFTSKERKDMFIFLLKCSLWGNKADLSLSCGKPVAANEETFAEMNLMDRNILVNDLEEVYNLLNTNEEQIIDIVLDNAGYELFNDLCFADYLVKANFAKKVIFHGKLIPWFVSDATAIDFTSIFDILLNQLKSEHIVTLVQEWSKHLENDKWEFRAEPFWITPYDYSKMSTVDPEQYAQLAKHKLTIFKGDLNYRKLVGDIYWEPTTSFKTALRGFEPTNVLSLRTVKADTIAGLKEGVFEELTDKDPSWLITGEYALIQLLKKK
ncbi:damage-control phosphatase ARMT1-like [Planococcus citri]|uniref:damage-control phosphatase ARMT1-like n=1 Tax=Planococcus citri TaxID=170843 RepID=UPI0031F86B8E